MLPCIPRRDAPTFIVEPCLTRLRPALLLLILAALPPPMHRRAKLPPLAVAEPNSRSLLRPAEGV